MNDRINLPDVMSGTVSELRSRLLRFHAEQAVVVLMDGCSAAECEAVASTLAGLLPIMKTLMKQRQRDAYDELINLLLPDVPLPRDVMAQAQRTVALRRAILESSEWLSASRIAELAGFSASNPSAQPNRWKLAGKIFAIPLRGADHYPSYALDIGSGFRPRKVMSDILPHVARPGTDPWQVAAWFAEPHPMLSGARPCDCLQDDADAVIEAARARAA